MYANVDGFTTDMEQVPLAERPETDRWILSLLNTLVGTVTEALEDYEPTRAARAINDFVCDNLSNWYVRLNRKRFWSRGCDRNKVAAYQTLYTCLLTLSKLIAPVAPFYSDRLYRDLTDGCPGAAASVHLADFPGVDASAIDSDLEFRMATAQQLTSLVLSLRHKAKMKVRQPLAKMLVPASDDSQRRVFESVSDIVTAEVNVKRLEIVSGDNEVFVKRVEPDFKKLGPKFGKSMKQAAALIKGLAKEDIARLERDGGIDIAIDGNDVHVDIADVRIISEDIPGWLVANEGSLTVALDIELTDALRREGLAREIINRVQNIRKDRGYEITDTVTLVFAPGKEVEAAVESFGDYIATQVLARAIAVAPVADASPTAEQLDIDGLAVRVDISRD